MWVRREAVGALLDGVLLYTPGYCRLGEVLLVVRSVVAVPAILVSLVPALLAAVVLYAILAMITVHVMVSVALLAVPVLVPVKTVSRQIVWIVIVRWMVPAIVMMMVIVTMMTLYSKYLT